MPDWSYQTLFRPLLFQLPSIAARDFTLQAMGTLSRLPGGSFVIRTLGHMESSPLLESELSGIAMRYPVGLCGGLDSKGIAHKALSQFGFGFIEIGPVTVRAIQNDQPIQRDVFNEAIIYADAQANAGLEATIHRLEHKRGHRLPYMIRTRSMRSSTTEEALQEQLLLTEQLAPYAAAFYIDSLDAQWSVEETVHHLEAVREHIQRQLKTTSNQVQEQVQVEQQANIAEVKPLFIYIPLDYPMGQLQQLLQRLPMECWAGIVIGDAIRTPDGDVVGRSGKYACLDKIRLIREQCGGEVKIIASGGVHEPQDALDIMEAGAAYVQLHSGLVYAGPGLPKRINEAIIYEQVRDTEPPLAAPFWYNWGWMWLLGVGMIVGGLLAWIIAATSVVLPYDILYLGMQPSELMQANPLVLRFMSHDRVTLAGTMVSIGILYVLLSYYGLRQGQHWAKTALVASCVVGFSSFFLYLGYGYFDPLHAAVAAILLPMFIISMRGGADLPSLSQPNLRNDRLWRRAQWGQLMMVVLGFALAIGGIVISGVGITNVFVPTDLQYLCATPAMLADINDRLIPLIAHDRAGFGGALLSNAIALLATALWGVNQGQRWLWWMFLIGGFPGFLAGFSVHWEIGYTDFWHLSPAYFAFALYVAGLVLLYPYLMSKTELTKKEAVPV